MGSKAVEEFLEENDWFSQANTNYVAMPVTSRIEMPPKKLIFGSLGKRIKTLGFDSNQASSALQDSNSDAKRLKNEGSDPLTNQNESQTANVDISFPMPQGDSSDEENDEDEAVNQPTNNPGQIVEEKDEEKAVPPKEEKEPEVAKPANKTMSVSLFDANLLIL